MLSRPIFPQEGVYMSLHLHANLYTGGGVVWFILIIASTSKFGTASHWIVGLPCHFVYSQVWGRSEDGFLTFLRKKVKKITNEYVNW